MLHIETISVAEQVERLKELMQGSASREVDASHVADIADALVWDRDLKTEDRRMLVVPKFSWWLPLTGETNPEWSTYNHALRFFDSFQNIPSIQLENSLIDEVLEIGPGPRFQRLRSETASALVRLEQTQPGDFIIWQLDPEPCIGYSPDEAFEHIIHRCRIPLDPIALISLVHTHPGVREQMPWLDALGAEVGYKGMGNFDHVPFLDVRKPRVSLDWNWKKFARSYRVALCAYTP